MNADTDILLTTARRLSAAERRDICTEELLRENRKSLIEQLSRDYSEESHRALMDLQCISEKIL